MPVTTGVAPPPPPPEPALDPLVWVTTGALPPPPPDPTCELCEPLLWVTTGEPLPPPEPEEVGGTLVEPLEPVLTGADDEDEGGSDEEPVEDEPVTAVPLDPVLPDPAPAYAPGPEPEPAGLFGLRCLVTWIVRRITLVRTSGFSATDADF